MQRQRESTTLVQSNDERLSLALDRLTGRFGETSIRPASLLGRDQESRIGYSEKPLRPTREPGESRPDAGR